METMVALYDNVSHAQQAAERLVAVGLEPRRITLILQQVSAIYEAMREAAEGDGDVRDEPLKQGGALVAVQLDEAGRGQIADTLEQYGFVDSVILVSDEARRLWREVTPGVQSGDFWIDVEAAFKRHFHANYAARGYKFKSYEPAYRFGFAMAQEAGRGEGGWDEVSPRLQEAWMARFPGDWPQFSTAIHHGWQVARGRRPGQELTATEIQTTRRGAQYRELSEEQ